jgi:hypothetical protein
LFICLLYVLVLKQLPSKASSPPPSLVAMTVAASDAVWLLVHKLGITDASQCRFCQPRASQAEPPVHDTNSGGSGSDDDNDHNLSSREILPRGVRRFGRNNANAANDNYSGKDEKESTTTKWTESRTTTTGARLLTIKPGATRGVGEEKEGSKQQHHATMKVTKARSQITKTLPSCDDCKQCHATGKVSIIASLHPNTHYIASLLYGFASRIGNTSRVYLR